MAEKPMGVAGKLFAAQQNTVDKRIFLFVKDRVENYMIKVASRAER